MKLSVDPKPFRCAGKAKFKIASAPTKLRQRLYQSAADLQAQIAGYQKEIDELQQRMYAEGRRGLLIIIQAMDAAGKDSTILHVMNGINPAGVEVQSFKRPSEEELGHDFLWRSMKVVPGRGRIGIFNRSYYEEVLVCKVHPEIVQNFQRLPLETTEKMSTLFTQRYEDIANYESYLTGNGIQVVKFFLHVSKAEQKQRFLDRIEKPSKNWKFNVADLKERALWDDYMAAYQAAINATATKQCPWYVVPADDKGDMRLIVSAAILKHLKAMDLEWPKLPAEQVAGLAAAKVALLAEQ